MHVSHNTQCFVWDTTQWGGVSFIYNACDWPRATLVRKYISISNSSKLVSFPPTLFVAFALCLWLSYLCCGNSGIVWFFSWTCAHLHATFLCRKNFYLIPKYTNFYFSIGKYLLFDTCAIISLSLCTKQNPYGKIKYNKQKQGKCSVYLCKIYIKKRKSVENRLENSKQYTGKL